MARTSRLLSKEVVKFAKSKLKDFGKISEIVIKLKAVIAAEEYNITQVAKIFGVTKATLISWIKVVRDESLELLTVQTGRGRKSLLTEANKAIIGKWLDDDSQLTIDQLRHKIISELGVKIGRSSVHRAMIKLRFSYITARPKHYKQNSEALPEAKKKSNI